jgi:hypothetical protein
MKEPNPLAEGLSGWRDGCTVYGILRRKIDAPKHRSPAYQSAWVEAQKVCLESNDRADDGCIAADTTSRIAPDGTVIEDRRKPE